MPSFAAHGPTTLVLIRGHVRDVFGGPVFACASASSPVTDPLPPDPADVDETLQPIGVAVYRAFTDEAGGYALAVPPGTYEVSATEAETGPYGRSCWDDGPTYSERSLTVNTLTDLGPTDFTLPFSVWGGTGAAHCCGDVRPGDALILSATVDRAIGDASASWTDEASGTVVPLVRSEYVDAYFGPRWRFQGMFPVPANRLDGDYPSVYRILLPGIAGAAEDLRVTTTVDSVAPVITATFPADGATNVRPSPFGPVFWAEDDGSGFNCANSEIRIYDVTDSGQRSLVPRSGDRVLDSLVRGRPCRELNRYSLVLGRDYEAEFAATDGAGNIVTQTVTFSTGTGDLFSGQSPTGTTNDPFSRIQVTGDIGVSPASVLFRISRTDPSGAWRTFVYRDLHFDPETRVFWIDPGRIDPDDLNTTARNQPALTPGAYRAAVEGRDWSGNDVAFSWEFNVSAG